jgi:AhpD family alkylhydroperoxidase
VSDPHLAPLPRELWGDDVRAALRDAYSDAVADRFFATGADAIPTPNALATLMHHPALAGPFLTYNNVLLQTPAIDPRLRELMILRVAVRTRAPYEWAQHVRLAGRAGITADEIAAVARRSDTTAWTPLEADLLAATDQLIDRYRIDGDTWGRLAEQLDERQLVELVFVVGTYTALAMAFNTFGLQLDPELQELASASLPEFEE